MSWILLQSQVQTARGTDFYINSAKTELICFKKDDAITTLNEKPLKLVENFTDLSSKISSTENTVKIRMPKKGMDCYPQVINHMEILYDKKSLYNKKSLYDKIK